MKLLAALVLVLALPLSAGAHSLHATSTAPGRVSIDWKDAQLTDALRLLARVGGVNLVLDPAVRDQTITLALDDVPWEQALDLAARTHGLATEMDGNVLRVAPSAKLQAERQQAAALRDAKADAAPLRTIAFPLSWAQATSAEAILRKSLSPRGTISVDRRTNLLLVTDAFDPAEPVPFVIEGGAGPGPERVDAFVDLAVVGGSGAAVTSLRSVEPPAGAHAPIARLALKFGERVELPTVPGVELALERDGAEAVLVARAGRSGAQVPATGRQALALSGATGAGSVLVLDVAPLSD